MKQVLSFNRVLLVLADGRGMSRETGFDYMIRACNKLNEGKSHFDQSHVPEAVSSFQECIDSLSKQFFILKG